jgi:Ca2+-binding RTX toxin-like protein
MTPILWGEFLVNTVTDGVQKAVQLQALNNGRFMAVWQDGSSTGADPNSSAIYMQLFYSGAVPQGDPIQVNTTLEGSHTNPIATALDNGRVVYTWEHHTVDASGNHTYAIRARIFEADGRPVDLNGAMDGGTEDFIVAEGQAPLTGAKVEALANGEFAITYNDANGDGAGDPGVKAIAYQTNGQAYGPAANVTGSAGDQTSVAVLNLGEGRLLSLYSQEGATPDDPISLKVTVLSTMGGTVTNVAQADVPLAGTITSGTAPTATLLANGKLIIAWTETNRDGMGDDVKAQVFTINAMTGVLTADGAAITVNKLVDGDQGSPAITALANGGFAISYLDSNGIDVPQVRVAIFDAAKNRAWADDILLSKAYGENGGERTTPTLIELSDGRLIAAWNEAIPGRTDDADGIRGQVIDARTTGIVEPGTTGNDQYVGTRFDDVLNGIDGNDHLNGIEGNDILDGGAGMDTLNGGTGSDRMIGGAGDDVYYVDVATDVVVEGAGGGNDKVYASISYALSAEIENLIAEGTAAINLTGNASNNSITGNGAANVINGGLGNDQINGAEGNDVLDGGEGADAMAGGVGSDIYYVDNAGDVIVESGGDLDQVFTTVTHALGDGVENVTALGSASIWLTGNAFNNLIVGNGGANKLYGGLGNDILTGGKGKDLFVFNTAPNKAANRDMITDFEVKADKIHLENSIFKKLKKTGKLKSDFFKIGTKAGDKNDYIIHNKKKGILLYDADGSGKGKAVEFATVKKNLALKADHFFII